MVSPQGYKPVKKPNTNQKDQKQVEAFRKAARELGCDEDEGRFQEALRQIAKAKPSASKSASQRKQKPKEQ